MSKPHMRYFEKEDILHVCTQRRHVGLAARLVGVDPSLCADTRLQVAETLSVPALTLAEAARKLQLSGGFVAQSKLVVDVLAQMPRGAYLAERIAQSGYLVGLWRKPLRWDPRRALLLERPFRPPRTRDPPPAR